MNTQELIDAGRALDCAIEAGEVLDAYQAAASLGVHHNLVFQAAVAGRIPGAVKMAGRTWLMTPEAVKQWRAGMKFTRK